MSLSSITGNNDDEDEAVQETHQRNHEQDLFDDLTDIELPQIEIPAATILHGAFEDEVFVPDEPTSLAVVSTKDEDTPKNEVQALDNNSKPGLPDEAFEKALSAAIAGGLNPEIADQLKNFCQNGLKTSDALLIATYALNGLDKNQVTQLALMGLSGRNGNEIKIYADALLGSVQSKNMTANQGSTIKAVETNRPGILSKMGSLLGKLAADRNNTAGNELSNGVERFNFAGDASKGFDDADNKESDTLTSLSKDAAEKMDFLKTGDPSSRGHALETYKKTLAAFADEAKRRIGSSKTLEEATTLLGMIKGFKAQHLSDCAEYLSPEENKGIKEFFKIFDTQIKRLFNTVKSHFKSTKAEDALNEKSERKIEMSNE